MKKIILMFAALSASILGAMPASIASHTIAAAHNSSANGDNPTSNASTDDDAKAQNFVGTVISLNGQRFILRDEKLDTWYHLDDQKRAGQYLGKKVMVVGVLDERTDEIHIQSIQESRG